MSEGLFVLFWRGCMWMYVCVCLEGGRSRKEGGGAFPCSWENGKSHCIEESKSSRNSNNAFPAWATATTDPWSRYISRERMLEKKKKVVSCSWPPFEPEKKWRRDRKARRERYSKGVCGTLSDLIDLLTAPGQRERQTSLMMVVIMFPIDLERSLY